MNSSSMELGPIGIWTAQFDYQPAAKVRDAAGELDQLAFGAVWFPESVGRESLTNAALLLSATSRIAVATGIANIYARDPVTTAAGQNTLAEAYRGGFSLVSASATFHLLNSSETILMANLSLPCGNTWREWIVLRTARYFPVSNPSESWQHSDLKC